jgi:nucleoside-diphosphate kinase
VSSLVLIKPDAIEQKLMGELISDFESFGIAGMYLTTMDEALCAKHYTEHVSKSFYPGLQAFMCSGRVCALAITGNVFKVREVAERIRINMADLVCNPRNLVHASDSTAAAKRELDLWFNSRLT